MARSGRSAALAAALRLAAGVVKIIELGLVSAVGCSARDPVTALGMEEEQAVLGRGVGDGAGQAADQKRRVLRPVEEVRARVVAPAAAAVRIHVPRPVGQADGRRRVVHRVLVHVVPERAPVGGTHCRVVGGGGGVEVVSVRRLAEQQGDNHEQGGGHHPKPVLLAFWLCFCSGKRTSTTLAVRVCAVCVTVRK